MSRRTLTPYGKWSLSHCSLDCVCQNGIWLIPCTDPICDIPMGYLLGKKPPRYPLPVTMAVANTMVLADQEEYLIAAGWHHETMPWNTVLDFYLSDQS